MYSARGSEIPARGKGLVDTDIQVKVPKGTYGRVAPRSGLAWKNHIDIGAGVVDEDYRGNLKVVMFNVLLMFNLLLIQYDHRDH